MSSTYVIGIDLGTTNSVVAFTRLDSEQAADIQLLPIPQLVAPGTIDARSSLPSFLYLPPEHERQGGSFDLPWAAQSAEVVGELARQQSASAPERSVGAAKSWLAHTAVDRHASILPWDAPAEVPKVSPVTAARRYLEHVIAAWNHAHPDAPLAEQQVVLTVPASFDASARELTRAAALAAGVPAHFLLLEEPTAAVYAWLDDQGDGWRKQLAVGDRLLVCDIGGGTTDLTLIGAAEEDGALELRRLAVGKHLLVGGDNMDLTLAHFAAEQFRAKGIDLDAWQAVSLWHACRLAKEALLSDGGPASYPVSVLGRGSRLIGGTVSIEVQRDAATLLVEEGFFPMCSLHDRPARRRQSGFVQLGLPFETDTAITRHIAAFLCDQAAEQAGMPTRPTHVLFNGGVFRASPLRQRLLDALGQWFPQQGPDELAGRHDLDFAVARGAAYYGWSKEHGGVRIRGGTARSYYIGIETTGLAIPGAPRPLKALCVVPFGMEEGTQIDVPSGEIGLVLGEPVQFRFFSSLVRKHDAPGDLLSRWGEDELQETDSLETCLPASDASEQTHVPVRF
jgi:molecular chaperone DnaK (HSP70)